MTTLHHNITGINGLIKTFMDTTARDCFRPAISEAAQVLVIQYRNILRAVATKPGNTGINAFQAVGKKIGTFRDGSGAWAVVGGKLSGGKMLAPQQRWGETGTVPRRTKAGLNRGSMPAQLWLKQTMEQSLPLAQTALKTRLNYLVSRVRVN